MTRLLNTLYFAYLTLLPSLATLAIRYEGQPISPWLMYGGVIFIVVIYLGVIMETARPGKTIKEALGQLLIVPAEIAIAVLLNEGTIWQFFLYNFLIEILGIVTWLILRTFRLYGKGHLKILLTLLGFLGGAGLVALGAFSKTYFGFAGFNAFSMIFLLGAMLNTAWKYKENLSNTTENTGYTILGAVIWFVLAAGAIA